MKDLIMYRCLSYIHGVIENKKPKCIYQIYRQNRFERHKAELTCVNLPKGKKYSTFFLYSQTQNYNKIPIEIKEKSSVNFKTRTQDKDTDPARQYYGLIDSNHQRKILTVPTVSD